MPLQNRVNPTGHLFAVPSRAATLMGNRGYLHNKDRTIRREWSSERRWIYCTKDVIFEKRIPMDPMRDSYTELFFLDAPTAMAAGHRPCFDCMREELRAFKNFWNDAGLGEKTGKSVSYIDEELDRERGLNLKYRSEKLSNLPAGVLVRLLDDDAFFLVTPGDRLLRWSFDGYTAGPEVSAHQEVKVVTPPSMVKVLAAGFTATAHPSAQALRAA